MAIGKKTGCLILWGALRRLGGAVPGASTGTGTTRLRGRHDGGRNGRLVRRAKSAGMEVEAGGHSRAEAGSREALPAELPARRTSSRAQIPAAELYRMLQPLMDQRLVCRGRTAIEGLARVLWSAPVKHEAPRSASQGTLAFGEDAVVYETAAEGESRTWRYADIDNITSSGPFQLTITTFERALWHYGDRKDFNFVLKQPITEAGYNQLWLQMERKNGKLP